MGLNPQVIRDPQSVLSFFCCSVIHRANYCGEYAVRYSIMIGQALVTCLFLQLGRYNPVLLITVAEPQEIRKGQFLKGRVTKKARLQKITSFKTLNLSYFELSFWSGC